MGVVLRTHPICGESHIQRSANREVTTLWTAYIFELSLDYVGCNYWTT